jgi:hypothetical protein
MVAEKNLEIVSGAAVVAPRAGSHLAINANCFSANSH